MMYLHLSTMRKPKGGGTKTSVAPDNLFKVDEDFEKLPQSKTVQFHNLVKNTLYASKQARPDTCTAVAFLTTIVPSPNVDNWSNMVYMMRYTRVTRTLPLILSANGSGILKWWVDASFAVHPNMQGHSGGVLSLGVQIPHYDFHKIKLNICSSTETELVGADDFMPEICWTRYFLKDQGYRIVYNVLF